MAPKTGTRWRTSQTCLLTQLCFYLLVVFIVSFLRFNWFIVQRQLFLDSFLLIYVRLDTGRLLITLELLAIFDLRYSLFRGRGRLSAAMLLAVMLLLIELCPSISSAATPVGSTAVTLECRASITVSPSLLNGVDRRLLFNADRSPIFTLRNRRSPSAALVALLLLRAGVESNPGPAANCRSSAGYMTLQTSFGLLNALSLIHISEPTRPY